MKTIYRIAKTELLTLFYSPVAWLVLMIFAFQVGINFVDQFGDCVKSQTLGYHIYNATGKIFTGWGLFNMMKSDLYLYLPLLTMGLISREIGSGSIKLLFSSPISTAKIVLGKYLAMVFYCLLFILILFVPILFSCFTVKAIDIPSILVALLGLYL